jgi:diguanylate cyclase (GGDEF)-like protein
MLGMQVLTFYAVIFALVSFTVLIPRIGVSIVFVSFIGFYIYAYCVDKAASIQTFNYIALMLICFGGTFEKYLVTIAKIKERIKTEELNDAYINIMNHDPLSRAKNRTALMEDLPGYFGKKIIVMIYDLDKFKGINDTYGHIAGDKVILNYSKIFCDVFGAEYVYRYGGDEFLVIRKEITEEEFFSEKDALRKAVDEMNIEGIDDVADYSFGYSFGTFENSKEFEELVIKADKMLYQQKNKKHSV